MLFESLCCNFTSLDKLHMTSQNYSISDHSLTSLMEGSNWLYFCMAIIVKNTVMMLNPDLVLKISNTVMIKSYSCYAFYVLWTMFQQVVFLFSLHHGSYCICVFMYIVTFSLVLHYHVNVCIVTKIAQLFQMFCYKIVCLNFSSLTYF